MNLKLQKKLLLMSRYAICGMFLQIFFYSWIFAANCDAQKKSIEKIYVSIDLQDISIAEAFDELERVSEFNFVYRVNILEKKAQNLKIEADNKSIADVLRDIGSKSNLRFRRINNKIYVKNASNRAQISNIISEDFVDKDISGKITDENSVGLPGASVLVKGSTHGTVTDSDGNYKLLVPDDATIVISYVGYKTIEFLVGTQSVIDFQMEVVTDLLDEVVVTALGLEKMAETLTFATQKVEQEEILNVKSVNYVNSLAGKVAGATITRGTMGPGSGTRILIRGDKSFTGNSAPLFVIDGVPVGRGDLLNPEDIESIQVLPGASAAALYGSRSANGVILVTTKKAKKGVAKITVSSQLTFEEASDLPNLQTKYGQTDPLFNDSWGEVITNGSDEHLEEFYDTGVTSINSISVSTGNDIAQVYLSYGNTFASGILPENKLERHNFNVKLTTQLFNDRLSLEGYVNYIDQKIYNRNVIGGYSAIPGILSFPTGDDWSKYSGDNFEVWDPVRQVNVQNWPYIRNETFPNQNPYWVQKRNQTDSFEEYTTSIFKATYNIFDWLDLQGRVTYDRTNINFEKRNFASTQGIIEGPNGGYGISDTELDRFYTDLLLIVNKSLGNNINVSGIAGFSHDKLTSRNISLSSTVQTSLHFPNYFSVYALNGLFNKSESLRETSTQALFANATMGYNDKVFIDITGRNEWSSTVSQSFFYPSIGLTYIIKRADAGLLSFAKVRASYAEVGNSLPFGIAELAPPYSLSRSGDINGRGALPFFSGSDTTRLKPERTKSFEIGTDLRFFDNKLNLNFTFYSATTEDQVFQIQAPAGSGAQNFWINGGTIRNQGFEGILSYNTSLGNIQWTPSVVFSHNKNTIRELSELLIADRFVLTSFNQSRLVALFLTRPKDGEYGSYGDLFGKVYEKDENGKIRTDSDTGLPLLSEQPDQFIGNANPDFLAGFNNTFTYKKWVLSFLIDGRFGGGVVNRSELWLDYKGLSERTGVARDAGGVIFDGKVLDTKDFYLNQTGAGALAAMSEYFYDATNIRMREFSLGYTFSGFSNFFNSISVSMVGRNLFLFYKKAPFDPEIGGSTSQRFEGMASFVLPATRSIGFNLRLNF